MRGYFDPREVLILEAELARAKMYLARQGVGAELVEANTSLLTGLVLGARRSAGGADVAEVAAREFLRSVLGIGAPAATAPGPRPAQRS